MTTFELHPRLQQDCHRLGRLGSSLLLLMDNAHFPWFVLVPDTQAVELHELEHGQQLAVLEQINAIARFVQQQYRVDKLNIGCIGNVVPQMHIHIVGRRVGDVCWPNVVWGTAQRKPYSEAEVRAIRDTLRPALQPLFRAE
jgi:diadenosine tetraphosphate (Ap4A) HIT family hydrolase